MQKAVKEPFKVIDPWGSGLVADYERIVKMFGLEIFVSSLFPKANRLMRRGVVFGGRDLKQIAECIKKKKPFYALSGIMPTAERVHFGNKMVVEQLKYFQDNGAKTYILVADLEAAATRGIPLEEARKRALNFHIPAYIALGLDPKKTTFYFQSDNKKVMHLSYEFSKKITLNEFKAIYGTADPSKMMSALTQAADILYPQLEKRMPGIIPVGIDQDPHIRLTRDIVNRTKSKYNFIPPSAIFHKYTPSLDGNVKMSKSIPGSYIELPEPAKDACKKLGNALTGGRNTIKEQRKLGGRPEKCMIFEMYKQHLAKSDDDLHGIYTKCIKGRLVCGDDKQRACKLMASFLNKFSRDLEKARKQAKKIKFIKFS